MNSMQTPASSTEDKVRAAFDQTAAEIAPGTLVPLELPPHARPARRLVPWPALRFRSSGSDGAWQRRAPLPGGRNRRGLAALGAAVAVIVIVAAAVLVARPGSGRQPAAPAPADAIPQYFAELTAVRPHDAANEQYRMVTVRNGRTGAPVAQFAAPAPDNEFVGVTADADGRAFALAAVHATAGRITSPARLFLLKIGDPRAGSTLTPLDIPPLADPTSLMDLQLSPDGRQLAIAQDPGLAGSYSAQLRSGRAELKVYSTTGGAGRTWSTSFRMYPQVSAPYLSWTADSSHISFNWDPPDGAVPGIRLLDLHGAGANLIGDSQLVVRQNQLEKGENPELAIGVLTPDGHTAITITTNYNFNPLAVKRVSVQTGRSTQAGRLGRYGWMPAEIEWSNADGSVIGLMLEKNDRSLRGSQVRFGILRGGRLTLLPVLPGILPMVSELPDTPTVAW